MTFYPNAVLWRKSSYSTGGDQNCVEVAPCPELVAIRDTKNRNVGHVTVPRTAWAVFTRATALGELSR